MRYLLQSRVCLGRRPCRPPNKKDFLDSITTWDCNIDSSRQLPNWNPLEYPQDLTFLIGSLDTQVGEAPLACIIKHESGQNLVFCFFAHVHGGPQLNQTHQHGMEKILTRCFYFFSLRKFHNHTRLRQPCLLTKPSICPLLIGHRGDRRSAG